MSSTGWFSVTFLSLSWRSLTPLKRSLNHPKKVTLNRLEGFFFSWPQVVPVQWWLIRLIALQAPVPRFWSRLQSEGCLGEDGERSLGHTAFWIKQKLGSLKNNLQITRFFFVSKTTKNSAEKRYFLFCLFVSSKWTVHFPEMGGSKNQNYWGVHGS